MSFKLFMPTKVLVGNEIIKNSTDDFSKLGKRCIVITGRNSAKRCGALDDLIFVLNENNIQYVVFDEVEQNPLVSTCYRAGRVAIDYNADFVVGIGGGSPLDAAKAVAVYAANPILPQYGLFDGWKNTALPIILIGTTSGTGSEVTPYSVLTRDDTGFKGSFAGPDCYAKISFGDPAYTASMPKHFTISTALDSISHCLESYFINSSDYLSQGYAIEGLRLGFGTLEQIEDFDSISLLQREQLYIASIYGGLAINSTGTALCHLMSYPLSEEKGVSHGYACAIFLNDFIRLSTQSDKQKAETLFSLLKMDSEQMIARISGYISNHPPINYTEDELNRWLDRWTKNPNIKKTATSLNENSLKEIAVNAIK